MTGRLFAYNLLGDYYWNIYAHCVRTRTYQADMAQLLQVHQTTYSDYERENLNIPIPILKKLAEIHAASIDYILGLTDQREPYPRVK